MSTELTTFPSKTHAARTLPVLLGLSLFALSGCSSEEAPTTAEQPAQDQTVHCEKLATNTDNLPSDVLVGTDIVDSGSFEDSNADLTGQYLGELGGATIGAMVDTDFVTRQFEAPGTDPDKRTFQPICIDAPYLFAEGLVARRVGEGLLWLERETGVDGIPSDQWMLLEPLQ